MALKITPTEKNARTVSITLSGQLNSRPLPSWINKYERACLTELTLLSLIWAILEMITSAGVGVVMKTRTSLAKRRGELMMLNMQPQIKKVFEIVRLLPTLTVFENTQEMDNYLVRIQQRIQEEGSFDSGQ